MINLLPKLEGRIHLCRTKTSRIRHMPFGMTFKHDNGKIEKCFLDLKARNTKAKSTSHFGIQRSEYRTEESTSCISCRNFQPLSATSPDPSETSDPVEIVDYDDPPTSQQPTPSELLASCAQSASLDKRRDTPVQDKSRIKSTDRLVTNPQEFRHESCYEQANRGGSEEKVPRRGNYFKET